MNLAVSSIAWTQEEEPEVAEKLQSLGVKFIELAPTKLWNDPTKATIEEIEKVVEWWKTYDITVVAFQSMLFSRPDLKLFHDDANRSECLEYLKAFTVLAGKMGVKKMVFGSPKNRQRGGMSYKQTFAIASDFFTEIGKTAAENGVVFCLEPNAPQYNCDFVTNAEEGARLVKTVNHSGFRLHLDTACMALAGDDITQAICNNRLLLEHFHISSPMLDMVEARDDVAHSEAAAALRSIEYDKIISIEMRPGHDGTNVNRVEAAVRFAQSTYLS